jgi:hypothetical protein
MKYDFLGKVYFDATGIATTLLTAGKVFKNSIYFEGDGGSWNLNDSLNVGKNGIFLLSGTLNTNNQRVRCGYFDSAPSSMSPRSLNLGTSEMILTSNTNPCWNVYQDSLSITANQSLLRFTGKGAGMLIQPYPFQNYHPSATVYNFNKVLFENTEGTATLANVDTIKVIFKYLIFQSHARIKGSMTFDTLVFTPGHLYEFQDGTWGNYGIYQINSLFSANGSCTNPILIRSIVAGARARIKSSSGVISVSNTSIRDIQAFGGASFIATDTRDLGNNTGWNISGPQ